ncbi:MAG: GIY-YIG nuclease family protein [Actinomycetaceae bacterium]|nr:GIY-YIG nuclease family protein [Actinomycetaceae bacterium]
MSTPRSINLFLIDGTGNGRIKCTLPNWTGVTYLIPRTDLAACKDRLELTQTGIYLLLGKDDSTGNDSVYIGQARTRKNGKGVLGRIKEHIGEENLNYWTHAIVLITSNDSFGATEISYLENLFYSWAISAGRFQVTNGNEPSPGNITEEKEAELLEFAEYSRLVIATLGYKLFDPIGQPHSKSSTENREPLLYLNLGDSSGIGRQTSDGFVVLAGSRLRSRVSKSCPVTASKARVQHAADIDSAMRLSTDVLFNSPSSAAAFIIGTSINGRIAWKTVDGVPLKNLETRDLL